VLGPGYGQSEEDSLGYIEVLSIAQRIEGTPREEKERQKAYLEHFSQCSRVAVIHAGRGEFMRLLKSKGIKAIGCETNPVLAEFCQDSDLDVAFDDPFSFMSGLDNSSLDGVFITRFAGYKSPRALLNMLLLCHKKLKTNGILLIETPNPYSISAISRYALGESDWSHPVHPATLKSLCLACGFVNPEVMFIEKPSYEQNIRKLDLISHSSGLREQEVELFRTIDENFQIIGQLLFGYSDYAIVARKNEV